MSSVVATAPARKAGASRTRPVARRLVFPAVMWLSLVVVLGFLVLPVLAIFVNTTPARLFASLNSAEALDALRLSLETTTIALAIIVVVGTPAAYLLGTRRFRGHTTVLTLIELPLVLPPAVAGIGLLAALGPRGLLGGTLHSLHVELVLQTAGVVVALVFVAAPFYLRQAQAAFAGIERTQLEAAFTMGASRAKAFVHVAIPLARPALIAGLALAWARALGEFGATLMFAGSFQGITQTAPLAIYDEFASNFSGALALSALLVIVSGSLLLAIKLAFVRAQPPM